LVNPLVAQETRVRLRLVRWTVRVLATFACILTAFLLSAWIGSSIPRNSDWVEPKDGITIMIETNGIHTGIVMPLVTEQKDWREHFALHHLGNPKRDYTHVSVSFGEREVFLETPRLSDIKPATAIRAILGGDGLLHASHYVRPAPDDNVRELTLTTEQYALLVQAIAKQMHASQSRQVPGSYADYDAFYDSDLSYHLGHTCNQWSADMLAAAGVKTGLWTPLSGGVMKWVP
jgi:uncharacterized protein (TIGR02117 family)